MVCESTPANVPAPIIAAGSTSQPSAQDEPRAMTHSIQRIMLPMIGEPRKKNNMCAVDKDGEKGRTTVDKEVQHPNTRANMTQRNAQRTSL
jgi:hypothetical protein